MAEPRSLLDMGTPPAGGEAPAAPARQGSLLETTRAPKPRVTSLLDPARARFQAKGEREIESTMRKGARILDRSERERNLEAMKMKSRNLQMKESGLGDITVRDVFNFMVGDDMKVVGAKWDQDGFSFSMENFKQTWSEDPLWLNGLRTLGLGLNFLPPVAAINKSLKVGKLGKSLGKGFKFVDWTQDQANPILKESKWFEAFPQKSDEIKWLKGNKFLNDQIPDVDISDKTLLNARMYASREQDRARKLLRRQAIQSGEDNYHWAGQAIPITAQDKVFDKFDSYFANKVWEISNATLPKPIQAFNASLQKFSKGEDIGRFFRDVPAGLETGQHDIAISKFWHDPVNNPLDPAKVDLATIQWATEARAAKVKHQDDMIALGAWDRADVPDVHVPFQLETTKLPETKKGLKSYFTQQHAKTPTEARLRQSWPDIESATLKERKTQLPDILRRLDEMEAGGPMTTGGRVIVDPREVTLRGLYVDRQIYHNVKFMKDFVNKSVLDKTAMTHEAMLARKAAGGKMTGYVHLENMPAGKELFRRVLQKNHPELLKGGEMPWISKTAMDAFFGPGGVMYQTEMAGDFLQFMVGTHKFMKTGLNPSTHLTNAGGNLITAAWAGVNLLDPRHMSSGKGITRGLMSSLKIKKANPHFKDAPELFSEALRKGQFQLGKIDVVNDQGKKVTFDLNDYFSNQHFQDIMEFNSFDEVEGLAAAKTQYKRMKEGSLSKAVAGAILKPLEAPKVKESLDWAGNMYLAEDFVPKAQMYFKYLADGLSEEAAGAMVARYMPMYSKTGDFVTGSRKWMLPWVTYPSEILRIAKNQMMDNPMKLMPWMHAVDFIQTGMAGLDGMNAEGVADAKKQLPFWARGPATVVAGGQTAGGVQGAVSGAVLGGLASTRIPGVHPAAGAIAGGVAGWLLGSQANDEVIRGATLNFLPLSALKLGVNPEDAREYYENMDAQKLYETLPVQPFSIFKPIMDVMSGQTAFGEPIPHTSGWDQGGKIWAGLVGFMSPPAVQTYGFKITDPDSSFGWMGLASGAAAGAYLGARAGGGLPGAVAGAALGGLTGANVNVARVGIDTGMTMEPRTMHLKEAPLDFILNNFGAVKSYAALPENQVAAEVSIRRELGAIRTSLNKQAQFEMLNGDESAKDTLAKVQATFSQQYPLDPKRASNEFSDWMDRFLDGVGESPMMRGMSKDEMKKMQRQLRKTDGDIRSEAMQNLIDALAKARRH